MKINEGNDDDDDERGNKCTYYNKKKRRFCDHEIDPNIPEQFISSIPSDLKKFKPIYCFQHRSIYSALWKEQKGLKSLHNLGTNSSKNNNHRIRRRIPCPLDPSHMIYEDKKEIHITKKCPKIKLLNKERQQIYYQQNVNTHGSGPNQICRECIPEERKKVNLHILAQQILTLYKNIFLSSQSTKKEIECLTEDDIYNAIPIENHFPQEKSLGLDASLLNVKIGGNKHLEQIGSIIGHARNSELLQDTKVILEMGAGRGMTGLITAGVTAATTTTKTKVPFVMIERAGSRSKADTTIRRNNTKNPNSKSNNDSYMKFENVEMTRIKCDLAHVHVPTVMDPILKQYSESSSPDHRPIVVVAKHLCGVGTDFALKSITPYKQNIRGCIFATCCHGVCNWTDYVGKQYLQTIFQQKFQDDTLFGPNEFHLMKKWTSASVLSIPNKVDETNSQTKTNHEVMEQENHNHHSTNNDNDDDATTTTTTGLENTNTITSIVEELQLKCGVQGLGRACQRLIDYGRLEYIKHQLFPTSTDAQLCHYVDSDITPQNALLKAFHHSK